MKRLIFSTFLLVCTINFVAVVKGTVNVRNWKYDTITHRLLKMEQEVSDLPDEEFRKRNAVIDKLIAVATKMIKPIKTDTNLSEKEKAMAILKAIDRTFTEMNFATFILTTSLTESLVKQDLVTSDCRAPSILNGNYWSLCSGDSRRSGGIFWTPERYQHYKSSVNNRYYLVDCDLSSILYLGIAEVNGLPMSLVETFSHNFIRYHLSDKTYINWDTNAAGVYTDDDYKNAKSPTSSARVTDLQIKNVKYLKTMTRDDVISYHYAISAAVARGYSRYADAVKHYREAIRLRPYAVRSLNNLAWLFIVTKELES